MIRPVSLPILLAGAVLAAAPARASQEGSATAADVAALRAEVESLRRELDALKAERAAAPLPSVAAAGPSPPPAASWKGAPELRDPDSGFSFKPKGFAQFDVGYVGTPRGARSGTAAGLDHGGLGWNGRARRVVVGVEGTLPGGFGYNVELNSAQGAVDYEDIVFTYQRPNSPIQVRAGNFFPLSSLETMTSSRLTSFLERAAFTDAFGYNRRLGVALALTDPDADRYTLTAGLFGQEINNAGFDRTGWQASVRGTFSPVLREGRLHLGASFQHRVAQRDSRNVRYRSRPFTQVVDRRFVDTGPIAADGDDIAGIELGAIAGPFHAAAEAQQVWVRGYRAGRAFGPNDGVGAGLFYAGDPSFRSAYAEAGYYLTGETRAYKGGHWERVRVLHPFDRGGWGALQVNARLDWLDLRDRVAAGARLGPPGYVDGGRQTGYQLSLIWNPIDYIRLQAQYARASFAGGPSSETAAPGATPPLDRRTFGVDTVALRAQVEF
jgi:phosphate-selective porin OprO/OprP